MILKNKKNNKIQQNTTKLQFTRISLTTVQNVDNIDLLGDRSLFSEHKKFYSNTHNYWQKIMHAILTTRMKAHYYGLRKIAYLQQLIVEKLRIEYCC